MTKRDLVVKISNEIGLTQTDVAEVVQKTLDYVADELAMAKSIELRNFGVFDVKIRKSRVGRNPNKPLNEVTIPERIVVKFRPGKELKSRLEKLSTEEFKRTKVKRVRILKKNAAAAPAKVDSKPAKATKAKTPAKKA